MKSIVTLMIGIATAAFITGCASQQTADSSKQRTAYTADSNAPAETEANIGWTLTPNEDVPR